MAVCAFLGDRDVYDAGMESKLRAAVTQIVVENESVEFLLYHISSDSFFNCCLLSALRARTCYPDKVTITLAVCNNEYNRYIQEGWSPAPDCMIDRIISPEFPDTQRRDSNMSYKQIMQWIIKHSTHIICCIYDRLYDSECCALRAKIPSTSEVINITSPEMEQAIEAAILLLSEREQYVFQARANGCSHKDTGQMLGVCKENVRKILHQGCRAIRKNLKIKNVTVQVTHSCALFALGKATHESLDRFNSIADFLICSGTNRFYVEHTYSRSAFMSALSSKHPVYRKISITVITDGNDDLDVVLLPPGVAIQCISDVASANGAGSSCAITDMINRADFCLCDLSSVDNAEEIQQRIRKSKRAVLLDMGKICT